jgi:hypothetical protein
MACISKAEKGFEAASSIMLVTSPFCSAPFCLKKSAPPEGAERSHGIELGVSIRDKG